jgi:hypothetical protein
VVPEDAVADEGALMTNFSDPARFHPLVELGLRTYDGFPDGIKDAFCEHAVLAPSQYGTTARALASELLFTRRHSARADAIIAAVRPAIEMLRACGKASCAHSICHEVNEILALLDFTPAKEST